MLLEQRYISGNLLEKKGPGEEGSVLTMGSQDKESCLNCAQVSSTKLLVQRSLVVRTRALGFTLRFPFLCHMGQIILTSFEFQFV